ncbi:hypothetical protein ISP08_08920 [Staphylococcus lloydii]|uniref:Uncharacterized protein n=1 Tax=Staphylococcus lloydii TaxID=2781774 RepID=A0A7T1AYH9_9STAP|nr:hypothetical protein [Staphylococcus lloydii]QPM74459.1 hypothetical protein ISP08_08920 [Staphylococcus lloydii]
MPFLVFNAKAHTNVTCFGEIQEETVYPKKSTQQYEILNQKKHTDALK